MCSGIASKCGLNFQTRNVYVKPNAKIFKHLKTAVSFQTEHLPGLFQEHKNYSHTKETHWAFKILITNMFLHICTTNI